MAKKTYFPQDEYARRWQAVYDEMERRGYETTVVWGRSAGGYERCGDVLYLTNYYSNQSGQSLDVDGHQNAKAHAGVVLHRNREPELHMDMPSYELAQLSTDDVYGDGADPIKGVADAMKRLGVEGKVAMVGSDFFPVKYARQLEEATPAIEWVPEDDAVQVARRVKSQPEIDLYRQAGETASRAINRLMEGLIQGKTEAEAAADAAHEVVRSGGRFHMIPVSHGDSIQYFTRSPISGFSQDAAQPGEMVRGWVYGPIYQGYWLDPGRTAVAGGKGTPEQRDLIEKCNGIVDGIINAIKPGARVDEVVKLGERLTEQAGSEENQVADMFPLFGHGIGLFWERPSLRIGLEQDDTFQEGMTFGIEAFLSRAGVGLAGYEQNILVGPDGAELLTNAPSLWW